MVIAHLSFHAGTEGKMKRQNVNGMINHTLRKTLDKYKTHGNEMIDKTLTKNNVDWTKGNRPVNELVDERIKNDFKGQRTLRKDAVVLREVIVQPSSDIFEGLTEEEKSDKAVDFANDSLGWFAGEFGKENVLGASLHMDESNPHAHIMIMPMTEDGRISQKDFFKGPSDLKRQHREYREFMNEKGWDFDLENKYENVKGVSLPKYKANAVEIEKTRAEQIEKMRNSSDIRDEAVTLAYSDAYPMVRKQAYADAYLEQTSESGDAYKDAYKEVQGVLLHEERKRLEEEQETLRREREALRAEVKRFRSVKETVRSLYLDVAKYSPYNIDSRNSETVAKSGIDSIPKKDITDGIFFGIKGAIESHRGAEMQRSVSELELSHGTAKPPVVPIDDGPEM